MPSLPFINVSPSSIYSHVLGRKRDSQLGIYIMYLCDGKYEGTSRIRREQTSALACAHFRLYKIFPRMSAEFAFCNLFPFRYLHWKHVCPVTPLYYHDLCFTGRAVLYLCATVKAIHIQLIYIQLIYQMAIKASSLCTRYKSVPRPPTEESEKVWV